MARKLNEKWFLCRVATETCFGLEDWLEKSLLGKQLWPTNNQGAWLNVDEKNFLHNFPPLISCFSFVWVPGCMRMCVSVCVCHNIQWNFYKADAKLTDQSQNGNP